MALALLAVCLVVGSAYWLLWSKDAQLTVPSSSAPEPGTAAASRQPDEQAALDNWNRKLQGDFVQLDQQRQLQQERTELARRQQEAEARAASAERSQATPPSPPQALPARPAPSEAKPAAPAEVATIAQSAAPSGDLKRASIDWSSCRRPQYPLSSQNRAEEGVVDLSFQVDANGAVQSGEVVGGSGSAALDEAALQALQKCRFKPATADGVAVASVAKVRFRWELSKGL